MTSKTIAQSSEQSRHGGGLRLVPILLIIAWALGLYDVVTHGSLEGAIFGRYSFPYFIFLLVYAALIMPLAWIFLNPRQASTTFWSLIRTIQDNALLAIAALLLPLLLLTPRMLNWERFYKLPIVHIIVLIGAALLIGILLFSGWRGRRKPLWRNVALGLFGAVLLVELLLQGLSFARLLPSSFDSTAGLFWPYGRLYSDQSGNSMTNRYGWNSPTFSNDDSYRVLLIGDDLLFGSDVAKQQAVPTLVENLLNASASRDYEVMALAAPGYGPQHYYEAIVTATNQYEPDEVIVMVNLRDDFINVLPELDPRTSKETVYYILDEQTGEWTIHPEGILAQHLNFHDLTDGFRPIYRSAVRIVRTHVLLPKLVGHFFGAESANPGQVATDMIENGNRPFVYTANYSPVAQKAATMTENMLDIGRATAISRGAAFKMVSIPMFPTQFLAQASGSDWDAEIGQFDLLAPEQFFTQFAERRQFDYLPAGEQMQADGISAEMIEQLYRPDGMSLTEAGHRFYAQMIVDHLFASDMQ